MADVKSFHDREGQTLTVWFGDRSQEFICEEAGRDVVLIKDRSGQVIGPESFISWLRRQSTTWLLTPDKR
jgi:hypothetical protein